MDKRRWNPKFGFFLPIHNNKNISLLDLTRDCYGRLAGPFPLSEVWDDAKDYSSNLDEFHNFVAHLDDAHAKPRSGDIIALCDYTQLFPCRHYLLRSSMRKKEPSYCTIIKSKKYKKYYYIKPKMGLHPFVTKEVRLKAKK